MNSICPKNQFIKANSSSGCLCPDPPKGLAPTSWLKCGHVQFDYTELGLGQSASLYLKLDSAPHPTAWPGLPLLDLSQIHSLDPTPSLRGHTWKGLSTCHPTATASGSRPSRTWVPRRVDACLEGFASLYFFQCSQSSVYRVFVCQAESSRSDPRLKNLTMNVSLNRSSARGIIDWSVCYLKWCSLSSGSPHEPRTPQGLNFNPIQLQKELRRAGKSACSGQLMEGCRRGRKWTRRWRTRWGPQMGLDCGSSGSSSTGRGDQRVRSQPAQVV